MVAQSWKLLLLHKLRFGIQVVVKGDYGPHCNRPIALLDGGMGRPLPIARTRSGGVAEKLLERDWEVACGSRFP